MAMFLSVSATNLRRDWSPVFPRPSTFSAATSRDLDKSLLLFPPFLGFSLGLFRGLPDPARWIDIATAQVPQLSDSMLEYAIGGPKGRFQCTGSQAAHIGRHSGGSTRHAALRQLTCSLSELTGDRLGGEPPGDGVNRTRLRRGGPS